MTAVYKPNAIAAPSYVERRTCDPEISISGELSVSVSKRRQLEVYSEAVEVAMFNPAHWKLTLHR